MTIGNLDPGKYIEIMENLKVCPLCRSRIEVYILGITGDEVRYQWRCRSRDCIYNMAWRASPAPIDREMKQI